MDKMTRPAALITGGATRLGLAFAKALANAGYDIALHYHRSIAAAASAAEDIETLGVKCITFQADLAAPAPETLINRVVDELPNLSVLINSASAYEAATIANTSMELLQQQFTVNFFAPFLLTQAFANLGSVQSGSKGIIINILDKNCLSAK